MNSKKKTLFAVLFALSPAAIVAQESRSLTLDYEDVLGTPVVEALINGTAYRFMFDTGASITSISDRVVNEEKLQYGQVNNVVVHGMSGSVYFASVPSFLIGSLAIENVEANIMSEHNPVYRLLGVDGIIGANILMKYTVTFDSRSHTIILAESPDMPGAGWKPLKFWNNIPVFTVQIRHGDELLDVPAIFDSGNGSGSVGLPSAEGFEQWAGAGIIGDVTEGRGAVATMVGGQATLDKLYRGTIGELRLGNGTFCTLPVLTGGINYLLLPFKMTSLGRVTIDYPNSRYNFSAYEDAGVWPGDRRPVMTGVDNGRLRIAAVWGEDAMRELKPGYIITAVGDTGIDAVGDSTPNIDELIRRSGAETVTVEDAEGVRYTLPASLFVTD